MADGNLGPANMGSGSGGKYQLMDDDPRLPKMPAKPTLLDYFTYRAKGINHLLQSATHALKASMPEETILACLIHDMSNGSDQGRSRLVGCADDRALRDEKVSWAVRHTRRCASSLTRRSVTNIRKSITHFGRTTSRTLHQEA